MVTVPPVKQLSERTRLEQAAGQKAVDKAARWKWVIDLAERGKIVNSYDFETGEMFIRVPDTDIVFSEPEHVYPSEELYTKLMLVFG
jgi:hypothetical protein